jgi:HEAT repeat protein
VVTIGGEKASSRARRLLRDESFAIRARAARAMGSLSCRDAIPELAGLLRDASPGVVPAALASLKALGASDAWRPLVDLLLEADDPAAVLDVLAALKPEPAVPFLRNALQSAWAQDRERAALGLGRLGVREAIVELRGATADPESRVRNAAARALGGLGVRDAIPDLEKALATPLGSVRVTVASALAALGSPRGKEELLQFLDRGSSAEKVAAASAVADLKMLEALPSIRRCLADDYSSVVQQGIDSLCTMGDRESLPLLVSLLESRSSGMWRDVVDALSRAEDGAWISGVEKLLRHRDNEVRAAAAEILCSKGHGEAAPELLSWAKRSLSSTLLPLNGVRRPHVWKRLGTPTLKAESGVRRLEWIERAAREAGLSVDLELPPSLAERLDASVELEPRADGRPLSAVAVLGHALEDLSLSAIVENDRLRILSRIRALRFWKTELSK